MIIKFVIFSIFLLFLSTIVLMLYIIMERLKQQRVDKRRRALDIRWEELVFNYLIGEPNFNEIKQSIYLNERLFFKFLFRFFENLSGDDYDKLNDLCIELDLHLYIYKMMKSGHRKSILEACHFMKYLKRLPNIDALMESSNYSNVNVQAIAIESLSYIEHSYSFQYMFERVMQVKKLPTRKKLALLNSFKKEFKDDILMLLKKSTVDDYQKSILVEVLINNQMFIIDDLAHRFIAISRSQRLRYKCVHYYTESFNNEYKQIILSEKLLFSDDPILVYYLVKYMNQLSEQNEILYLYLFFAHSNLWVKEELIKGFQFFEDFKMIKPITNGKISEGFNRLCQEKVKLLVD